MLRREKEKKDEKLREEKKEGRKKERVEKVFGKFRRTFPQMLCHFLSFFTFSLRVSLTYTALIHSIHVVELGTLPKVSQREEKGGQTEPIKRRDLRTVSSGGSRVSSLLCH